MADGSTLLSSMQVMETKTLGSKQVMESKTVLPKTWIGGGNHGLGEAPIAAPTLMLCDLVALEEVEGVVAGAGCSLASESHEAQVACIQISSAPPKPQMMEAGSDTCHGSDGASSQFRLGMCFLRGKGVEQNTAKVC